MTALAAPSIDRRNRLYTQMLTAGLFDDIEPGTLVACGETWRGTFKPGTLERLAVNPAWFLALDSPYHADMGDHDEYRQCAELDEWSVHLSINRTTLAFTADFDRFPFGQDVVSSVGHTGEVLVNEVPSLARRIWNWLRGK